MEQETRFNQVRFVIITGLSGAGKSIVVQSFEDLGYFCVDNLPPTFIPKFAELLRQSEGRINKIALVSDIRGGKFFESLQSALEQLKELSIEYEILFLEADTLELIKRFKETRRKHPLWDKYKGVKKAIEQEQKELELIRTKANMIINTSTMTPKQLKEKISRRYTPKDKYQENLSISIMSFGFKHGLPLDPDLVFDVRFLPNPYYLDDLRPLSGNDKRIDEYVRGFQVTQDFMDKLLDMLKFLLPNYLKEGRTQLIIAIGCTGGKHRSVVLANWLKEQLIQVGYLINIQHRDIDKT
ncbi:RNase adapter RapZ [Natranaerobius trueperi]|uniref:RNase adaptor protein RapZ n=1 Tax=Natranaerobius trueperi TaxID=759412 RepID=A0A226C0A2_9FIRM|nr:RNase adapter RapZ [Natranaerobius trueperi]OWZ83800.1 RNase adaptor protein RapZ [Natranaerobius trueperi]